VFDQGTDMWLMWAANEEGEEAPADIEEGEDHEA